MYLYIQIVIIICKPYFSVLSFHLPMASSEKLFSFLIITNTNPSYESPVSYGTKVMANIKVLVKVSVGPRSQSHVSNLWYFQKDLVI